MNFQCSNCGANMVFDPSRQQMFCEHCNSVESQKLSGNRSVTVCAACGGEVAVSPLTSASRCAYCGNYLIFDERIEGNFKPDSILPFKISKKDAVDSMKKEFKKRIFTPTTFLTEPTLKDLNGYYVPYFLFDYKARGYFEGEGTKIKRWTAGGYDYTETSHYLIKRELEAYYDNIPADASYGMDDECMDLVEPYDYKLLLDFDPKFMSGFFGEIYNAEPSAFEDRAKGKAKESADDLIRRSVSGYATVSTLSQNVSLEPGRIDYTLLPVWLYVYKYQNKFYRFYVNGQNGKVVGETPVSKKKVFAYGTSMAALIFLGIKLLMMFLEVL